MFDIVMMVRILSPGMRIKMTIVMRMVMVIMIVMHVGCGGMAIKMMMMTIEDGDK